MSNFFGIIKKQADTLPFFQLPLKDRHSLNESHFCFEENFDISIFDNDQLLIMLCGFVYNIPELCSDHTVLSSYQAEAIGQIYLNDPQGFQAKLLGNFAISIFNKTTQELVLVRDHFGARPLYILNQENFFAFSTDLGLLSETKILPLHLNQRSLIDFLSLRIRDGKSTFYTEIERLRASHILRLKRGTVQDDAYSHIPSSKLEPRQHPIASFTDKFETAIRNSQFADKKIGLMLSGGLDSSAIAIGMKNTGIEHVETFSANYTHLPEKQRALSDETKFQAAVSAATGFNHNAIPLGNISPLASIERQLTYFHEPIPMPNLYLFEQIANQARFKEIEIMVDGQDGDNIISHGTERFPELLKKLNIIGFAYEILRYSLFNQIKLKNTIRFFASHILLKWGLKKASTENNSIIRDEIFFDRRFLYQSSQTAVDSHSEKLASPLHGLAFEWRYLFFKFFNIEVRSPFYNMALINFCLSLPSHWKLRHGKTRYILRNYLQGQISDLVSQRPKKADLSHGIISNITPDDIEKIRMEIENIDPFLKTLIDHQRLLDFLDRLANKTRATDYDAIILFSFYSTNLWLRNNKHLLSD
jgi:asparagine synthase (glutamine-hydrolysing)